MEHVVLPGRKPPPGIDRLPFSDAVRAGETVYIAGRIGLDRTTGKPPADVADEARVLMDDVCDVLRACGLTTADLAMVTIFAPDVRDFAAFNAVYLGYFGERLPARAFIGSGPLLFGARFELTAIACAQRSNEPEPSS